MRSDNVIMTPDTVLDDLACLQLASNGPTVIVSTIRTEINMSRVSEAEDLSTKWVRRSVRWDNLMYCDQV